jgi:3-oxoacyl-[acyl-carrier-protein] synthase-3
MDVNFPLQIIGAGRYVPERVVTAAEIEALCNVKSGWVARRAGVLERRWVSGETAAFMGAAAAREAMAQATLDWNELDLILNASGTVQQAIPDGASLLQRELGLGLSGIPCMSVNATCLSFLVAIDMAATLLATGRHRTILIYASDVGSAALNFEEPESSSLIGDGAAAVVVRRTPDGETSRVVATHFATYGAGSHLTEIRGGGSARHPANPATQPEDNLFHMEGPEVLRMALKYGGKLLEGVRPGLSQGMAGVKWVIPHQTSLLGIKALHSFGWKPERIVETLSKYGNCVAASLPMTLYEAIMTDRLQRGDEFLLVGTGAGLSMGAMILVY